MYSMSLQLCTQRKVCNVYIYRYVQLSCEETFFTCSLTSLLLHLESVQNGRARKTDSFLGLVIPLIFRRCVRISNTCIFLQDRDFQKDECSWHRFCCRYGFWRCQDVVFQFQSICSAKCNTCVLVRAFAGTAKQFTLRFTLHY